jgi:hypothetical protein
MTTPQPPKLAGPQVTHLLPMKVSSLPCRLNAALLCRSWQSSSQHAQDHHYYPSTLVHHHGIKGTNPEALHHQGLALNLGGVALSQPDGRDNSPSSAGGLFSPKAAGAASLLLGFPVIPDNSTSSPTTFAAATDTPTAATNPPAAATDTPAVLEQQLNSRSGGQGTDTVAGDGINSASSPKHAAAADCSSCGHLLSPISPGGLLEATSIACTTSLNSSNQPSDSSKQMTNITMVPLNYNTGLGSSSSRQQKAGPHRGASLYSILSTTNTLCSSPPSSSRAMISGGAVGMNSANTSSSQHMLPHREEMKSVVTETTSSLQLHAAGGEQQNLPAVDTLDDLLPQLQRVSEEWLGRRSESARTARFLNRQPSFSQELPGRLGRCCQLIELAAAFVR